MFRLGILGSDNSHADRFSQLANLENGVDGKRIDDVQVTHIYGTDPGRTKEVAENGNIPNIVSRGQDMLGQVDGVICVWRHGSKHMSETLPFLEAGIPAFVDKPLAASVADARNLIDAAEKSSVGLTSFSTLRFAKPTIEFVSSLPKAIGAPVSGISTGPADLNSKYDGIFFYGIHAVELMNATFGYGCESVSATAHGDNCVAICTFPGGVVVTLNLLGKAAYVFHVSAFGTEGYRDFLVDSSTAYYDGMQIFVETMRTGKWPFTRDRLLEPVKILAAIDRSLAEKRTILLTEVM